jgi:DNA-binding transcriptional regulator YhcF (GntR family)
MNQDFRGWLGEFIDKLEPGQWLPSDAELAGKWDISARTVRRVMTELSQQGVVERVQGKGTRKPSGQIPPDIDSFEENRSSSQRLCEALQEAIAAGQLRRGDALPQLKYICLQYHVSDKTVIRAYELLEQQGLVRKIGRYYRVGGFEPLTRRPVTRKAYLVTNDETELEQIFEGDQLSEAYQKLDRELRSCGILLKCTVVSELLDLQRGWINSGEYPAGVYLWRVDGKDFDERVRLVAPFLRKSARPGLPIVVDLGSYDGVTEIPGGLTIVSRGNLTTTQSRSIAEFLTESVRRDIVLLFDGAAVNDDARQGFLKYQKTVYEVLQHSLQPVRINQAVIQSDASVRPEQIVGQAKKRHQGYVDYLQDKYADVIRAQKRDVFDSLDVVDTYGKLVQRFGKNVLWLCTRDSIAEQALKALEQLGVKVPDEVSLMTLENAPQRYHLGVSACTPDYELVGYLMAHAIIGDMPLRKTRHGYLRVPCPVTERSTTIRSR